MKKGKFLPVKTFFYGSEQEEFSGIKRAQKRIDENYRYLRNNPLWNFAAFVVRQIFVLPFGYIYLKMRFGLKIENKSVLKPYLKTGCFLYGNHTQVPGDGFIQALVAFPKKSYAVVNADNVALKGTENLMLMIGALPLPTTIKGYRNFLNALYTKSSQGYPVAIYPEAHIWPFYTGIRHFPSASFRFPAEQQKPSFSFTVVYKKRKIFKIPKIKVVIDGPFLPQEGAVPKEAAKKLRDEVYEAMRCRSAESDCEYFRYLKKEEVGDNS